MYIRLSKRLREKKKWEYPFPTCKRIKQTCPSGRDVNQKVFENRHVEFLGFYKRLALMWRDIVKVSVCVRGGVEEREILFIIHLFFFLILNLETQERLRI